MRLDLFQINQMQDIYYTINTYAILSNYKTDNKSKNDRGSKMKIKKTHIPDKYIHNKRSSHGQKLNPTISNFPAIKK